MPSHYIVLNISGASTITNVMVLPDLAVMSDSSNVPQNDIDNLFKPLQSQTSSQVAHFVSWGWLNGSGLINLTRTVVAESFPKFCTQIGFQKDTWSSTSSLRFFPKSLKKTPACIPNLHAPYITSIRGPKALGACFCCPTLMATSDGQLLSSAQVHT